MVLSHCCLHANLFWHQHQNFQSAVWERGNLCTYFKLGSQSTVQLQQWTHSDVLHFIPAVIHHRLCCATFNCLFQYCCREKCAGITAKSQHHFVSWEKWLRREGNATFIVSALKTSLLIFYTFIILRGTEEGRLSWLFVCTFWGFFYLKKPVFSWCWI